MTILEAREALDKVTPLSRDCGKLCRAACCKPLAGEEISGMLLFPTEAELYRGVEGFVLHRVGQGDLCACSGHCDRSTRPLACRMFPLVPRLVNGKWTAVMDRRARVVCPLYRRDVSRLDPSFVRAVTAVGEALYADPLQRTFLKRLWAEQDEYANLAAMFGAR